MYLPHGLVEFKVDFYKFFITLLLGGNTGLLGFLIRYGWKNFRKYKNAFMVFLEEHEKLVEDYIQRHPEETQFYPNYFSRLPKRKKATDISFSRRLKVEDTPDSSKWDE
jgi:hypothetical protein